MKNHPMKPFYGSFASSRRSRQEEASGFFRLSKFETGDRVESIQYFTCSQLSSASKHGDARRS